MSIVNLQGFGPVSHCFEMASDMVNKIIATTLIQRKKSVNNAGIRFAVVKKAYS